MKHYIYRAYDRLFYPYLSYWRARRHTDDVLATIDRDAFYAELLPYKFRTRNYHYQKYFNIAYWLRLNVMRALSLGLHRQTGTPLNILDLGAGFGYFPYVARFYNHNVTGVDIPGDQLFDKAAQFFELDIRHYTITPLERLDLRIEDQFDLVTAFQVTFNGHKTDQRWGVEEWRFFLDDLFDNYIRQGGRFYMALNYEPELGGWLADDVRHLFKRDYNARFDGLSRVMLQKR